MEPPLQGHLEQQVARGTIVDRYEAKSGTLFFSCEGDGERVSIMLRDGDVLDFVPIEDLVEWVEVYYHGSEVPTAHPVEE